LPGKSILLNCLKKINIFQNVAWENQNFSKFCLEKSKSIKNLPGKIEIFRKFACKIEFFCEIA